MSPCYSPASTRLNAASAALPTIRGLVSSSRSARASKCQRSRLTLETHRRLVSNRPPEVGDQRTPRGAAVQLCPLRSRAGSSGDRGVAGSLSGNVKLQPLCNWQVEERFWPACGSSPCLRGALCVPESTSMTRISRHALTIHGSPTVNQSRRMLCLQSCAAGAAQCRPQPYRQLKVPPLGSCAGTTTVAPAEPSALVISRPIPAQPPVTIASLP